jgi:prepilin-type processing-associated H-X9-DG protein
MNRTILRNLVLLIVVFLGLASQGCWKIKEAAQRSRDVNDLKQLGLALLNFDDTNQRFPRNQDEFLKDAAKMGVSADILDAVRSGKYVIVYSGLPHRVISEKSPAGASGTVLGYLDSTPNKGGPVLFCDGSVAIVTADEFKSKPLASSIQESKPAGR